MHYLTKILAKMEGAAAAPLQEQEQGKVQEQVEKALRSERVRRAGFGWAFTR